MTPKERAAMQQALDTLNEMEYFVDSPEEVHTSRKNIEEAITALREALAEQAEQEPVVKYYGEKLVKGSKVFALLDRDLAPDTLLYAAPVRTKDLTDDEIHAQAYAHLGFDERGFYCGSQGLCEFARAVIAAYKEKNK